LSPYEGLFLGIVQGLTEFLPVSSSGHLVIVQSLMEGFRQPGVLFDVMLHMGTLLAVLFFFRRDIVDLLAALLPQKGRDPSTVDAALISTRRRLVLYILAGTAVTGIVGVTFEDGIHRLFASVEITAFMLLVTGGLLFFADRVTGTSRREEDMTLRDGILIGLVQGISLIPGISRSGSTIAAGMFSKLEGETAGRFAFLLSIPAIMGAMVLELKYIGSVPGREMVIYLIGALSAAVTGFLTLKILFFMIKKRKLRYFAYYCWFVGVSVLVARAVFHA